MVRMAIEWALQGFMYIIHLFVYLLSFDNGDVGILGFVGNDLCIGCIKGGWDVG